MDLTYFTTLFLMLFLPKNETISQCFLTVAQSHVLQSLSKSDQNIEDSREQHLTAEDIFCFHSSKGSCLFDISIDFSMMYKSYTCGT